MVMKTHVIPVKNEEGETLLTVDFVNNLTQTNEPAYVNMNGLIGITQITGGRYEGYYALCVYDPLTPDHSEGELLTEYEAYEYLESHGRWDLIEEFHIHYEREREVL